MRWLKQNRLRFQPRLEKLEDRATPAALAPCDFTSLGILNPGAPGVYTINTNTLQIRDPSNALLFTGVVSNGIAVFDFDNVQIANGITFDAFGNRPLAILSHNSMTINGAIDSFGQSAFDLTGFFTNAPDNIAGGAGGGAGGVGNPNPLQPGIPDPLGLGTDFGVDDGGNGGGPGGGQGNQTDTTDPNNIDPSTGQPWWGYGGAGGGAFGGAGAQGADNISIYLEIALGTIENHTGGLGGNTYGNLFNQLQGGSGGGGSDLTGGGGGGGGIELGAVQTLTINGTVDVHGGSGAVGNTAASAGGSGGGIFLHGQTVTNNGLLDAHGGDGGQGGFGAFADAGGGGGGRIAVIVATNNSNFHQNGTVNLAGGVSGGVDPGSKDGTTFPPGFFGPGVADTHPAAGAGTLDVTNQPLPPTLQPLTGPFKFYFPARYTFNAAQGTYSGNITVVNNGADINSGVALVFAALPKGVTIVNAGVSTGGTICQPGGGIFGGGTIPAGLIFINNPGPLLHGQAIRFFVVFTNPFHLQIGNFFHPAGALLLFPGPLS